MVLIDALHRRISWPKTRLICTVVSLQYLSKGLIIEPRFVVYLHHSSYSATVNSKPLWEKSAGVHPYCETVHLS